MSEPMIFSGERFIPEVCKGAMSAEHLHRYALATSLVRGLRVADIACGEGYGSAMMAKEAYEVVGVDRDISVLKHAESKYKLIPFRPAESHDTRLPNFYFDAVISFETIEHVDRQEETIAEFKRILKPDGFLLISTPNPAIYSPDGPHNPYHKHEMTLHEFYGMLTRNFQNVRLASQNIVGASVIASASYLREPAPEPLLMPSPPPPAKYFIAACSDADPPKIESVWWDPNGGW
jgi:2-polyprenyl-3-methyl-5-hydroxy-6-metoxy-1,4-benzoquinol methylase